MPDAPSASREYDFAVICTEAIFLEKTNRQISGGPPLTKGDVIRIIREMDALRMDKPAQPKAKPRNPLLDALATLNGAVLAEVTPAMFKQAVGALRDIKTVCPDVTPTEIQRRAATYRAKWPAMTLSPTALAKWWGDCGAPAQAKRTEDFTRI